MSREHINKSAEKIDLIIPTTGKLFFEHKPELQFCKPKLMPIKPPSVERWEDMQRENLREVQEIRLKSAAASKSAARGSSTSKANSESSKFF